MGELFEDPKEEVIEVVEKPKKVKKTRKPLSEERKEQLREQLKEARLKSQEKRSAKAVAKKLEKQEKDKEEIDSKLEKYAKKRGVIKNSSERDGYKKQIEDLKKQLATFRNTKNGEDRTIPLADNVVDILKRYPFGKTFFRVSSYDSFKFFFKQACRKANIDNFRTHDLRACFITNALLSGMPQSSVAAISGHKDYRSMKRYTRIKAQDLVDNVNRIVPMREIKNR